LEIRKIKSHIKTEALILYIPEINFRIPFLIRNFEAYYDERKALKEILKSNIFNKSKNFIKKNIFPNKRIPIIGDGIYSSSNELIGLTIKKDLFPVFKIKKPFHNKIKSKQRKLVKKIYQLYNSLFKKRFNVEGLFGNIKNKFQCFVNAATFEVANTLVYAKFLTFLFVIFLFLMFFYRTGL
jgi:hypothetical protein